MYVIHFKVWKALRDTKVSVSYTHLIMKRGDKLEKAVSSLQENPKTGTACENEIADMGLRYDLTLPLSRYFANNKDKLTLPMKCIQMDRVYRAERPQKGRLREFVQCDIDIIGSDSTDSEVELILTRCV